LFYGITSVKPQIRFIIIIIIIVKLYSVQFGSAIYGMELKTVVILLCRLSCEVCISGIVIAQIARICKRILLDTSGEHSNENLRSPYLDIVSV